MEFRIDKTAPVKQEIVLSTALALHEHYFEKPADNWAILIDAYRGDHGSCEMRDRVGEIAEKIERAFDYLYPLHDDLGGALLDTTGCYDFDVIPVIGNAIGEGSKFDLEAITVNEITNLFFDLLNPADQKTIRDALNVALEKPTHIEVQGYKMKRDGQGSRLAEDHEVPDFYDVSALLHSDDDSGDFEHIEEYEYMESFDEADAILDGLCLKHGATGEWVN